MRCARLLFKTDHLRRCRVSHLFVVFRGQHLSAFSQAGDSKLPGSPVCHRSKPAMQCVGIAQLERPDDLFGWSFPTAENPVEQRAVDVLASRQGRLPACSFYFRAKQANDIVVVEHGHFGRLSTSGSFHPGPLGKLGNQSCHRAAEPRDESCATASICSHRMTIPAENPGQAMFSSETDPALP
jgi:hypothetical protein